MQNLEVISVNIWQILISLSNLVILFFIVKKILFKPVVKIKLQRENEINAHYETAQEAERIAELSRNEWNQKLGTAKSEADLILMRATENAKHRSEKLLEEAKSFAETIIRQAKVEVELEHKKSAEAIKTEIVEVAKALAEKMLEREIITADHRTLIDSFIDGIGEVK